MDEGVWEGHRHCKTQASTQVASYLLGSGFAWVLKSFLLLDSFFVSFLASGSDGEGVLLPSGSVFGGSPLRYTCICWLWRGGGGVGHARKCGQPWENQEHTHTHTCTDKRKKKEDASNSKSKWIQAKIISKKKKDANLHKENQNWKENKKSKTVSMTRCINLTVNQVAVLQYETQTMCIIIHDDVY